MPRLLLVTLSDADVTVVLRPLCIAIIFALVRTASSKTQPIMMINVLRGIASASAITKNRPVQRGRKTPAYPFISLAPALHTEH
mmetsp:Transcript_38578/g.86947  ORF Transcript_38578/g.86947 Transcript_38578/m.86947 type:complete len:84 (-) Transcript_38578:110-361(-)